jgi:hypothetical protein
MLQRNGQIKYLLNCNLQTTCCLSGHSMLSLVFTNLKMFALFPPDDLECLAVLSL